MGAARDTVVRPSIRSLQRSSDLCGILKGMFIKRAQYRRIVVATLTVASVAALVVLFGFGVFDQNEVGQEPTLSVVWPAQGGVLSFEQLFQVDLTDTERPPGRYRVTWSVDGGVHTGELDHTKGSRFSATVDVRMWDWKRDGRYPVEFVVRDERDRAVARRSVSVFTYERSIERAGSEATATDSALRDRSLQGASVISSRSTRQPSASAAENARALSVEIEQPEWSDGSSTVFIFKSDRYTPENSIALWKSSGGSTHVVSGNSTSKDYRVQIDFSGWRWMGDGPYHLIFSLLSEDGSREVARDEWQMVRHTDEDGEKMEFIHVASSSEEVDRSEIVSRSPTEESPVSGEPSLSVRMSQLPQRPLYSPQKPAVERSIEQTATAEERGLLRSIRDRSASVWLNGDGHDSNEALGRMVADADTRGAVPVFVLYNIPNRDCGSHSSGGAAHAEDYRRWIDRIGGALRETEAIFIVEPDALAQLNCLPGSDREERLALIRYAAETIGALPRSHVYIDAGHPFWVNQEQMAARLMAAGVDEVSGFALNVSNFVRTDDNIRYGTYLSNLVGGARFVIDTSRNGNGPDENFTWCNPRGRALGEDPRIVADNNSPLDAFLWIKYPGESDGTCGGGPSAGQWWAEYALELARNR